MTSRPLRTAVSLLAVALLGAACSSSTTTSAAQKPPAVATTPSSAGSATLGTSTPGAPAPSTTPADAAAAATLTIRDFAYAVPASVHPGAAITIVNKDGEAHTVTVAGGPRVVVQAGMTTMLRAPSKPGTYKISCDFHGNMHGDLLVS